MSRRVVVVDSPDPKLFEQAIFIVRNDAFSKDGVTAEQVVSEACRLARGYTATLTGRRGWRISTLPWYVLLLLGGLAISLLWLAVELI